MARVHTEVGWERNSGAEPEEDVQDIKRKGKRWVASEGVGEGGRDEVEEREHREDGDEHHVVDNAWVAAICVSDHVADERHYEDSPEELQRRSARLRCQQILLSHTWSARSAMLMILDIVSSALGGGVQVVLLSEGGLRCLMGRRTVRMYENVLEHLSAGNAQGLIMTAQKL